QVRDDRSAGRQGPGGGHGVPPPVDFSVPPSATLARVSASVSPDDSFDLHAVRQRLGTRAIGLDLESALTRWRAAGGAGDAQASVDWILAERAGEAVMVTAVLPPRLQAALASPEAAATILMAPPDAEGLSERTIVGSVEG